MSAIIIYTLTAPLITGQKQIALYVPSGGFLDKHPRPRVEFQKQAVNYEWRRRFALLWFHDGSTPPLSVDGPSQKQPTAGHFRLSKCSAQVQ